MMISVAYDGLSYALDLSLFSEEELVHLLDDGVISTLELNAELDRRAQSN